MSLFSGAVIHNGQISISINTLYQSPTWNWKFAFLKVQANKRATQIQINIIKVMWIVYDKDHMNELWIEMEQSI